MMARLEALNASGRGMPIDDVFAVIPIFALGCRQSLAFDGQQWVEIHVTTALDPHGGITGRRDQINLAAFGLLIRLFNSKLEEIPPTRVPCGAIEMRTEQGCQSVL